MHSSQNANPYPLMFSLGNSDQLPCGELPAHYQGNTYCYKCFEEESKWFDDSNYYGNPFEEDFKSQREEVEEEDVNYSVLGLKRSASNEDIKQAFRTRALETHPDKPGGSSEEFQKVREAYENLI